ncbi:helix-turn-helix transcriptional regulator [Bacillus shivajii]|uniref:helix-turn-helix domain-containing protein n=1 Tax=Bacillus shivajii TaxID=1983719 RepID=UPI001CFC4553|nr:helix-turn-helix domain-containing protein [Bacillus shivajii]UCZ53771.1 helix-turn-helix transcriptional regulator [Bacillus shivajii]
MAVQLGRKIKELRQFYGISQAELCEGICHQSYISKLEKSEVHPSAYVLSHLAVRLGVSMNYFFDQLANSTKVNYIQDVMNNIAKSMDHANYAEVLEIIKLEKNNPLFQTKELKQYLLWREGICVYHLYHDKKRALSLLNDALSLATTTKRNRSERELDILSSIAIIHSIEGDTETAEQIYEDLLQQCVNLPLFSDEKIYLRILFNASKNKYRLNKFKESKDLAHKGVLACLNINSIYMLGELYYQRGKSLLLFDGEKVCHALEDMKKAKFIFEIKKNKKFVSYVDEEIEKLHQIKI